MPSPSSCPSSCSCRPNASDRLLRAHGSRADHTAYPPLLKTVPRLILSAPPFNAETIKAIEAPHHHQPFVRLPRPLPSTPAPINASPRTPRELRTSQAPHQLSSPGLLHQNTPPPSAPTTTAPPCCPAASLPLTLW
jgi:hypothetical protein